MSSAPGPDARIGRDAGIAQFRETQRLYQRDVLDLMQTIPIIMKSENMPCGET